MSYVQGGDLYLYFTFCNEAGYDTLVSVDPQQSTSFIPLNYSSLTTTWVTPTTIRVLYLNWNNASTQYLTHTWTFSSGFTHPLTVRVLGNWSSLSSGVLSNSHYAQGCPTYFDYSQSVIVDSDTALPTPSIYAVLQNTDPSNVLSYDPDMDNDQDVWESTGIGTSFHGNEIQNIWGANGVVGSGKPVSETNVQHIEMFSMLGLSISQLPPIGSYSVGLLTTGLMLPGPALIGGTWTYRLPNCTGSGGTPPPNYIVCLDTSSPSYYLTTGADCAGVSIPAGVLTGADTATFEDGQCCAVDCSGFTATLSTTPSDYSTATGTATITVSGGTANYTYLLTVPGGITYGGTANPGATSSTSHTFTVLPGVTAANNFIITATDASGCVVSFEFGIPSDAPILGCTNNSAVNYNANADLDDDSCLTCASTGELLLDGLVAADLLVQENSVTVTPTTGVAVTDGSIFFSGIINSEVIPFVTASQYTLILSKTTNFGGAIGVLVSSQATLTQPEYSFTGLASGWYVIQAKVNSMTNCVETFYYYVPYSGCTDPNATNFDPNATVDDNSCTYATACDLAISFDILPVSDGCSGILTYTLTGTAGTNVLISIYVNSVYVDTSSTITVVAGDYITGSYVDISSGCTADDAITADSSVGIFECVDPEPISGCTDVNATNYNPLAVIDDGTCSYPVPGCTDPTASNYNTLATINDGSCIYPILGCTDIEALNYEPLADTDDGSCIVCDENTLSVSTTEATTTSSTDGTATAVVISTLPPTYTVKWYDQSIAAPILVVSDSLVGPTNLASGLYKITLVYPNGCGQRYEFVINATGAGCTDPGALNYDPEALVDDGSCLIEGCTDPIASNFNNGANIEDNSCNYNIIAPPCIPAQIDANIDSTVNCIWKSGSRYYTKLLGGLDSKCNTLDTWKLIFIEYLLSRKGLDCIYNCADGATVDYSNTLAGTACSTRWATGGPSGGSLTWSSTETYYKGDIVKHATSGMFYILQIDDCINGCYDPETSIGQESGNWKQCIEPVSFSDNTNYIDNFINFVNKHCADCEISSALQSELTITQGTVSDNLTSNGIPLNINGQDIDL